jgi:hypothetical protein
LLAGSRLRTGGVGAVEPGIARDVFAVDVSASLVLLRARIRAPAVAATPGEEENAFLQARRAGLARCLDLAAGRCPRLSEAAIAAGALAAVLARSGGLPFLTLLRTKTFLTSCSQLRRPRYRCGFPRCREAFWDDSRCLDPAAGSARLRPSPSRTWRSLRRQGRCQARADPPFHRFRLASIS